MNLNEHQRDSLNFLGLLLASFATLIYATDKLIATKSKIFVILVITSLGAVLLFGFLSSFEMIKGMKQSNNQP